MLSYRRIGVCWCLLTVPVTMLGAGCFLVGYGETLDVAAPDAGQSGDGASWPVDSGDRDAETADAASDAGGPEGEDAAVVAYDAAVDAALPEDAGADCGEGGCPCPPGGSACAGDLWLTCDEAGAVQASIDCRSVAETTCTVGVCIPALGCAIQPGEAGTPCDDGLFCTALDTCTSAGLCEGRGDPCADSTCVSQSCSESVDACVVDAVYAGTTCGDGLTCDASGACVSDANCSGVCTPQCVGSESSCELSCHDAQSCEVACRDGQECQLDCRNTLDCAASCEGVFSDCGVDCESAGACAGRCDDGDCTLDCDGAGSCAADCTGIWSTCALSCEGNPACTADCDFYSRCALSSCLGGDCATRCHGGSECEVNCVGAKSCTASCELDSSCAVDCTDAESCAVTCSLTSQCWLICPPGSDSCGFSECAGGATRCSDGSLACHAFCP